ncbi:MAG: hypothetical protein ACTSSE_08590 [Candidatus Thorarchaeota archaeon]
MDMDEAGDMLINRIHELVKKESLLNECLDAMQTFCDRVDKGEVRSVKTYGQFKEILDRR